jgi:D-glycero-alpha-D-manno-heptose 1-phosphate guanylyltransferase
VTPLDADLPLEKGTQIVILCGGMGTRIKSVLPEGVPKSMADVNNEPFIRKLILHLYKHGGRNFVLALGYQAHVIQTYLESSLWPEDIEFIFSRENAPLGTAGALMLCSNKLYTDNFFVVNGDTFAILDFKKMLNFHTSNNSSITIALAESRNVERYGLVQINSSNEITSFEEKPLSTTKRGLINSGVYLFRREILNFLPSHAPLSLEKDVIPQYIQSGLLAYLEDITFIDIGTPESYAAADIFLKNT